MISPIAYIQLRAFARQDGFLLGCLWIVTFAFFVTSLKDPSLQLIFFAGIIATPFFVYNRLKTFRDKVLGGSISYRRAFAYTAMTMVYGSIILAAATLVYFYFFDKGAFLTALQANLTMPEIKEYFTQAGLDFNELQNELTLISQTRPIDFAFSVFCDGIIGAVLTASILGSLAKKKVVKIDSNSFGR